MNLMEAIYLWDHLILISTVLKMENDDEIPSGIANSPPVPDLVRDIEIPHPEYHREIDQTNILD